MKKFFYLIGLILFSVCVFASCQTSLLNKVKNNISEESQTIFSGKSENYYVTLTSGKREEPYKFDGISRKKVDFGVINITFFHALNHKTIEFEIEINQKKEVCLADKNFITNSYMFDLEKKVLQNANIKIIVLNKEVSLSCKSNDFVVDYSSAIEKGVEQVKDKINLIIEKKANFEVFLKLATPPNNFDDVFVWYFYLQSDIAISSVVVIDCMSGDVSSTL